MKRSREAGSRLSRGAWTHAIGHGLLAAGGPALLAVLFLPTLAAAAWPTDSTVNVAACTARYSQKYTVAASDGAGGLFMAWEDDRPDTNGILPDIYAQHLLADGSIAPGWPPNGAPVCTTVVQSYNPTMDSDGMGGALIAYFDAHGPPGGGYYVQRLNAAGVPLWTVNGVLMSGNPGQPNGYAPSLVSDRSGGAFVAWVDGRIGFPFFSGIFAQHVSASGTLLWPAAGVPVCTISTRAFAPVVALDGMGGLFVAWNDLRVSPDTVRIFAQHLAVDGTPLWPVNGVQVSTSPNYQGIGGSGYRCAANDLAGGVYIGWSDQEQYGPSNAYVQHLTSTGAPSPGWPATGIPVSFDPSATHFQAAPILTPDGAGGVVLTFRESRFLGIRAQRVAPDGTLLWGASGLSVFGTNAGLYHETVSDSAGGFVFGTVYSTTVFAQRVSALGVPQWKAGGVVIGGSSSTKADLAGAADGAHGAIFAWSDHRNDAPGLDPDFAGDIYAQNVQADGSIGGVVVATRLALVSADARPDRVVLRWFSAEGGAVAANVYRSGDGASWTLLASIVSDGTGLLRYEDREVAAGRRYGYRLGVARPEGEEFTETTWVEIPTDLALALDGPWPQPAASVALLRITLPRASPVRLVMLDVAGREVAKLLDGPLDPGQHTMRWEFRAAARAPLRDGVYFATLEVEGRRLSRRVVIVR